MLVSYKDRVSRDELKQGNPVIDRFIGVFPAGHPER